MKEIAEYLGRAQKRGQLRFMLIGARGLEAHGYVRNTRDVDFLISHGDVEAMHRLLKGAGYEQVDDSPLFSRWCDRSHAHEDIDVLFVSEDTFEKLSFDAVDFPVGHVKLKVPSPMGLVSLKLHAIKSSPDRLLKDGADIGELAKRHPDILTKAVLEQLCLRFGSPKAWEYLSLFLP